MKSKEKPKREVKYWVVSGSTENWKKGIKDRSWGVKKKLKKHWDKIVKGDILVFYASRPISGVIGLGLVSSTFRQDKPLWPDEIRINKVIYPYGFEFEMKYSLPKKDWTVKNISIRDLKIGYWAGLNPLINKDIVKILRERIMKIWHVDLQ